MPISSRSALADAERHGYAIMQEVATRTAGAVRVGPGTLYGSLKRLVADGLVEPGDERADPAQGARLLAPGSP